MEQDYTLRKGLGWFIAANAIPLGVELLRLMVGSIVPLDIMLAIAAVILLYRSLSWLREFHRDYGLAFQCLLCNIGVKVAAIILAILWLGKLLPGTLFLWADILLEVVAVPVLNCMEIYYVLRGTRTLTEEAGYVKLAHFGLAVRRVYMVSTVLQIAYQILGSLFEHTYIVNVSLALTGISFVCMILVFVFLFRAWRRLE